jgi:hypothetical protein
VLLSSLQNELIATASAQSVGFDFLFNRDLSVSIKMRTDDDDNRSNEMDTLFLVCLSNRPETDAGKGQVPMQSLE